MNPWRLPMRGLRFYWRTHAATSIGCALSTAILVGALWVGDSVRAGLEGIARARLGRVEHALDWGERFFRDDLPARLGVGPETTVAAALRLRGMAIADQKQVNRVVVLGIDSNFAALAGSQTRLIPGKGEVLLSEKLAAALGAKAGDEISLRIHKPSLLSRDAPLASKQDRDTLRAIFTVRGILGEGQLGRFSLRTDQSAPFNAFVNLKSLQSMLQMEGLANVLLAAGPLGSGLTGAWTLEDAGLVFRSVEGSGILQLESRRIYLDRAVAEKALAASENAAGSIAYLVNSITAESTGRSTPYSFVTAVSRRPGQELKDDEIVINRWLADQLSVGEGDAVKVAYWELTDAGGYVERSSRFAVRGILEMDSLAVERELVPDFPGLTDVGRCEDWDIGLPLEDRGLKDPANEAYWKAYRQTPKAIVALAAGRRMWANRFGDLMAVRFPSKETIPESLSRELRAKIDPSDLGLAFRPVKEEAARAVADSSDLGWLFLGMSAFLVAASLILTSLLFAFSIEQRERETGVFLAIGFRASRIRRLYLAEGTVVAAAGALAGIPLGYVIARALVAGLGSTWSGATANASVVFSATTESAAIGAIAAVVISIAAMAWTLVFQTKRPVRELVSGEASAPSQEQPSRPWIATAGLAVIAAGAIAVNALGSDRPAAAFFAAGSVALIGGVAFSRWMLARLSTASSARVSPAKLGLRNASRRPIRSLAAIGLLACGSFILASVSSMREDPSAFSGTGGFELYGESSLALHDDLNTEKGRHALRLTDPSAMTGVSVVQFKKREGDDASCLNLNQPIAPPLLGVDPSQMASFSGVDWGLLERNQPDGVVPAIVGDSATAVWKLKRDVLDYQDERGRSIKVMVVGAIPTRLSLLQGQLIVSHRHFSRMFPSESGYRVFLVDAPAGNEGRVREYLTTKLEQAGIDLTPSALRIGEFYVVESTYLAMFLVLGALGLILGGAGLGILALRQTFERRGELALLRSVGFSIAQLRQVVMAETAFLVGGGLAVGLTSAAVAVAPAADSVPLLELAAVLTIAAALCLLWVWIAVGSTLSSSPASALKNE